MKDAANSNLIEECRRLTLMLMPITLMLIMLMLTNVNAQWYEFLRGDDFPPKKFDESI